MMYDVSSMVAQISLYTFDCDKSCKTGSKSTEHFYEYAINVIHALYSDVQMILNSLNLVYPSHL